MKILLPFTLLMDGAGLMQASIIENITFDLSALQPGSTLSGTFTLSNSRMVGVTAPIMLSFSDPADYTPTSLASTIAVEVGLPLRQSSKRSNKLIAAPLNEISRLQSGTVITRRRASHAE